MRLSDILCPDRIHRPDSRGEPRARLWESRKTDQHRARAEPSCPSQATPRGLLERIHDGDAMRLLELVRQGLLHAIRARKPSVWVGYRPARERVVIGFDRLAPEDFAGALAAALSTPPIMATSTLGSAGMGAFVGARSAPICAGQRQRQKPPDVRAPRGWELEPAARPRQEDATW